MIIDYFKNKICTVLTVSVNMDNLSKSELANIFTGKIIDVDDKAILIEGLQGLKSYFNLNHVVGILEEEVVMKDDPRIQKSLKQPLNMEALSNLVRK